MSGIFGGPAEWLARFLSSLWKLITGSGRDALSNTLETLLLRPDPNFSVAWFLDRYDRSFYAALIIAALVRSCILIRAVTQGHPMGVAGALLGYLQVAVVGYCIPAIATIIVRTTNDATDLMMWVFGGKPEVSWFNHMLATNPMGGWQSMVYAFWNIVLLFEATALSLLMYLIAIIGPILYAFGGLGRFGDRMKRLLWLGLVWPGAALLTMVGVLALGNWLMKQLPAAFFATQNLGIFIGNMIFIILAAVSAVLLFFLSRKTLVTVENKLKGSFAMSGSDAGFNPAAAAVAGTTAGAAITNRRTRMATSVVTAATQPRGEGVRTLMTQVALAGAKVTPLTAAAVTGATAVAQGVKRLGSSDEQKPTPTPAPSGNGSPAASLNGHKPGPVTVQPPVPIPPTQRSETT